MIFERILLETQAKPGLQIDDERHGHYGIEPDSVIWRMAVDLCGRQACQVANSGDEPILDFLNGSADVPSRPQRAAR